MKQISLAILALWLCLVSVSATAGNDEVPDYWVYKKAPSGVAIYYNGRSIKFLSDIGDGAFDRAIKIDPARRYVFLDSRLTLDDASNIVSFWTSLDPKTPTDFVVTINGSSAYRFVSKFERVAVSPSLQEALGQIFGTTTDTQAKQPSDSSASNSK
jgi:hypothetical protein